MSEWRPVSSTSWSFWSRLRTHEIRKSRCGGRIYGWKSCVILPWRLAHELKAIATRQYEHGAKLIVQMLRFGK